jgi:hypothetical protein
MQPDLAPILERLSIARPPVGFYDAPDPAPFAPLVVPKGRQCVFRSLPDWHEGRTLHLTKEKHGCGGMHLLGLQERCRQELVDFLCGEEGLKATPELMNLWLDSAPHYTPQHEHLLIGPLKADQYEYLRSVTWYVDADQLSVLTAGAIYYGRPDEVEPLVARFGSGCMQLVALFDDLGAPQALIGSLDQAARADLDRCTLAFTVTKPMLERLAQWAADPKSSLHNRFLDVLLRARGGTLG